MYTQAKGLAAVEMQGYGSLEAGALDSARSHLAKV